MTAMAANASPTTIATVLMRSSLPRSVGDDYLRQNRRQWPVSFMALHLSTYAYGEPRRRNEGVRIGCARLPVRGVRKEQYAARDIMDVWLPTVAPSRELLAWALKNN